MSAGRGRLRPGALALVAAIASIALLTLGRTAGAASDLTVTLIDCQSHPRKIAIQNLGDSAQNLTGWKLESDRPEEVFDLGVAVMLGAGETLYVFNGHNAPETPQVVGDSWIYGWNPTPDYDPSAFVLWEDGQDFIQIVDPGGNVMGKKPCPLPPGISTPQPTQQPQPTQAPSDANPGLDSNQPSTNQPDGTQTGSGSQANTGSANTTQSSVRAAGATGGEVFGPPAPGAEAPLPAGGGPPVSQGSLTAPLIGMLAGAALMLGGVAMMGLASRDRQRRF